MSELGLKEQIRSNKMLLPLVALLVAIAILLVCNFLPLLSSTGDYRARLLKDPDGDYAGGDILTNKQCVSLSMQEYAKIYRHVYAEDNATEGVLSWLTFGGTLIFALVSLMFALIKKPGAVIIFNVITCLSYYFSIVYITDTNIMSYYQWGFGKILFYIALGLVFAGAIWMLIVKKLEKRAVIEQ